MSVLTELAELETTSKQQFDDLVARIVRGDDVPASEAQAILQANGKTRADLQRVVSAEQAVMALRAKVEAGQQADAAMPELRENVKKLIEAREAAHRAANRICSEAGGPIEAEIARLMQVSIAGSNAAGELERMKPKQPQQTFEQRRAEQQELLAKQVADKPIVHRDPTGWIEQK